MLSWILHDLKMPLGRKLMVIAFLSFGIAVTIVGAVRTSVLVKVFVIQEVVPDPTYGVSYVLSNIEFGLVIIGTCGPTIKYTLGFCFPKLNVIDESSNRNYIYPSGGLQPEKRVRRRTRTHHSFQELDEVELTNISGIRHEETGPSDRHHGGMSITKTVAWRVDGGQDEPQNIAEYAINEPRTLL